MDVKVFGVVGSGQMGNGIAQVAAQAGLQVIMSDINREFVEKGLNTIKKNLDRAVSKGKMDEAARNDVMGRIKPSTDLADFGEADFVVEAVPEILELKEKVFTSLDEIVAPGKVISSNTVECLKAEDSYCRMAFTFGLDFVFCKCPLRKYVALQLGR